MNNIPCPRTCPDRSPTCHGSCQKYLQWSAERRQYLDQQRLKRLVDGYPAENGCKRMAAYRRHKERNVGNV